MREVDQMPVHPGAYRRTRKTFADVLRDLFAADRRGVFLFVSAFQCDDHISFSSLEFQ